MRFIKAESIQVIKPVTVKNEKKANSRLLILHKGNVTLHTPKGEMVLYPNRVYFLPADTPVDITYGKYPIAVLTKGQSGKSVESYIQTIEKDTRPTASDVLSIIDFSVEAYNAIDFFSFMEFPAFEIEGNDDMNFLVSNLLKENQGSDLGKTLLLESNLVSIVVMLLRYVIDKRMFLQKIALKSDALTDVRLVNIFSYVGKNLSADLSNANIAKHVELSKEYVGQFFKKNTGMNLQEYVKTMRISKAVELITTTNKKIQEICTMVGIDDCAYFCRIFRSVHGSTAKQVQQRTKQMKKLR